MEAYCRKWKITPFDRRPQAGEPAGARLNLGVLYVGKGIDRRPKYC